MDSGLLACIHNSPLLRWGVHLSTVVIADSSIHSQAYPSSSRYTKISLGNSINSRSIKYSSNRGNYSSNLNSSNSSYNGSIHSSNSNNILSFQVDYLLSPSKCLYRANQLAPNTIKTSHNCPLVTHNTISSKICFSNSLLSVNFKVTIRLQGSRRCRVVR